MTTRGKLLGLVAVCGSLALALALGRDSPAGAQPPAAAPPQIGRYQPLRLRSAGGREYEGILDTATGKVWGLIDRENPKRTETWAYWSLIADEPKLP
jgi:hypothetical protein